MLLASPPSSADSIVLNAASSRSASSYFMTSVPLYSLDGYARLVPSKRESATTHRIGDGRRITRQESRWIKFTMEESATTAIMYDNRISKFYRRIASRIVPSDNIMLTKKEPYRTMNNDLVQRKYKRMWGENQY